MPSESDQFNNAETAPSTDHNRYTSKRSVKIVLTYLKKIRFYPLTHTYINRPLSNEAFNALS